MSETKKIEGIVLCFVALIISCIIYYQSSPSKQTKTLTVASKKLSKFSYGEIPLGESNGIISFLKLILTLFAKSSTPRRA